MQKKASHASSQLAGLGVPTLHGRVENWECDFNNHWNARFYARSFQLASETVPFLPGVTAGDGRPRVRHLRFHGELFVGAVLEIRSMSVQDGRHRGAVVHLLSSGDRLSATCLDLGPPPVTGLPCFPSEQLALVLPRGLSDDDLADDDVDWREGDGVGVCETGPVRPDQLDHRGDILLEEIIRRSAHATHRHVGALGLNETLLKETGISRMAVETRVTPLGSGTAGVPLRVKVRISTLGRTSFTIAQLVESHAGARVARVEHSLVVVDLNTRRVVELPDFLRRIEL